MKKIAVLMSLLMLVSCFVLVACDSENSDATLPAPVVGDILDTLNGKTVLELYVNAMKKLESAANYTVRSNQDIKMSAQFGRPIDMSQTVQSSVDGQKMYAKIDNSYVNSMNMECWFVEDMYYLSTPKEKKKAHISYEKFMQKYAPEGTDMDSILVPISESWLANRTITCESEERFCVSLEVSASEFQTLLLSTGYIQGEGLEVSGNAFYDVFFGPHGNLIDIRLRFNAIVSGTSAFYDITTTVCDVGTTSITPPANSESWEDVSGKI